MEEFEKYLKLNKKSQETIKNYILAVEIYKKWLLESTNVEFSKLIRENIIDFIFYMRKVKKSKKGIPLRAESINQYISGLVKFNEYLVKTGKQKDIVVTSKDKIKVQRNGVNPCKVTNDEIKEFRQKILESNCRSLNDFERIRNYCLVCILEFCRYKNIRGNKHNFR